MLDIQLVVIYPYFILNSAPNFHSYFTLRCFRCFRLTFSDIFHTLTFSYSALRCFPQSSDIFPHSNVLPTPMFPKSSCSIPCSNVFRCFPYFYRCGTFQSYYGPIFQNITISEASWTLYGCNNICIKPLQSWTLYYI